MTDRELMQKAADKLSIMVGYPGLCLYHEDFSQVLAALRERLAQQVQEPVAWPCHIIEADFSERTITLGMESGDYKVSAGTHYLSITPPQRQWVGLTDEENT